MLVTQDKDLLNTKYFLSYIFYLIESYNIYFFYDIGDWTQVYIILYATCIL